MDRFPAASAHRVADEFGQQQPGVAEARLADQVQVAGSTASPALDVAARPSRKQTPARVAPASEEVEDLEQPILVLVVRSLAETWNTATNSSCVAPCSAA
jgi:hypothetical protein